MNEIYVSTDIEADGPIPGPHSMLSLASAAYRADKTLVGTFARNLHTLEGAAADPKTEAWWKTQPEAWAACRSNLHAPIGVMREYVEWLRTLPGRPVFVGYPVSYDFMFVYWYLMRFVGESPFSHSALDIKTFAMCLLGCWLSRLDQAKHAEALVRRPAPHARRARRRDRTGGSVLQHARGGQTKAQQEHGMSRFRISARVFALTPALLAALRRYQDDLDGDEVTAQYDAFLLDPGLGPATYLTSDGRIVWDDYELWNVGGTRAEAFAAIASGAQKTGIGDLRSILPAQRPDSVVCPECAGTGRLDFHGQMRDLEGKTTSIVCPTCAGVGWSAPSLVLTESVLEG